MYPEALIDIIDKLIWGLIVFLHLHQKNQLCTSTNFNIYIYILIRDIEVTKHWLAIGTL
jgi:hypothetical protein